MPPYFQLLATSLEYIIACFLSAVRTRDPAHGALVKTDNVHVDC